MFYKWTKDPTYNQWQTWIAYNSEKMQLYVMEII